MSHLYKIISALLLALVIAACSSKEKGPDLTAEELYSKAKGYLDEHSYSKAVENFQEIERLYPFSKLAGKGQVMSAYAKYKEGEFDDAVAIVDTFTKLNPGNANIAYMYYLKALCYYEQIADVKRDQKITHNALTSLQEVINRFPDSEYARDSKIKLDLVRDHLAGKEMEVGRFYLRDKKYVAAINRFRNVIEQYQTTSHIEEALYRMVESHLSLGLPDEAKKNAAVLGHNYPNSKWYHYAYRLTEKGANSPVPEEEKSWLMELGSPSSDSTTKPLPKDSLIDSWFKKLKW